MTFGTNPLCWSCQRPMGGLAPTTRVRGGPEVHLNCADQASRKLRVLKETPTWIVKAAGARGRAYWTHQNKSCMAPKHYSCVVMEVTKNGLVTIELDDGYVRSVPRDTLSEKLPSTAQITPGRPRPRA